MSRQSNHIAIIHEDVHLSERREQAGHSEEDPSETELLEETNNILCKKKKLSKSTEKHD